MARLSCRDYTDVLDLAVAVIDGMAGTNPWSTVTDQLNKSLRGNATMFVADLQPARKISRIAAWSPHQVGERPLEPRTSGYGEEHPLTSAYVSGDKLVPLTVNDVSDARRWRDNSWYEATDRRFDHAVRHLALPLPAPRGSVRAFVILRPGRDFGARDRDLARRVLPLLVAIDGHLTQLQRLHTSAASMRPLDRAAYDRLTPRELAVLSLLADGLTAVAIGRRLGISPRTVTKHQEHLYRKLRASDRLAAVLTGQGLGLLALAPRVPRAGPSAPFAALGERLGA
jgi:DNA-binding CsgD family transcriptional regulator